MTIKVHKFGAYKRVRLRKPTTCFKCFHLMPYHSQAMRCGTPALCMPCWKVITGGVTE